MAKLKVNDKCIICGETIDINEPIYVIKRAKLTNILYKVYANIDSKFKLTPVYIESGKKRIIYHSGKNSTYVSHKSCMINIIEEE